MPQVKQGYSLDHAYRSYIKSVSKKSVKFKISKKEYREICKEYIDTIVDLMLEKGETIKLPYGLGDLKIRRSLTIPEFGMTPETKKRMKIDWFNTKKLWKEHPELKEKKQFIYHLNEHSDGWYAVYHWTKFNIKIKGRRSYSFDPAWTNARRLSKLMQQPKYYTRFFTL
jgi:nucleoid DNA-binding protein